MNVVDEPGRAAYLAAVRAGLLTTYGVPAPTGLDRLILEAAMCAYSPDRCVAFIGGHFELEPLPRRIQSKSKIS